MPQISALLKSKLALGDSIEAHYGDNVRVVSEPAPVGTDLVVQRRPNPAFGWQESDRYNMVEDGSAASSADAVARELAERYALAKALY